ncbi:hypothetical protein KCP70_19525 [Salmonella enterica subsp. enterica]|nr:hypothetical protein KCP70_19525 [Salmonella enterica subsp. enterica]
MGANLPPAVAAGHPLVQKRRRITPSWRRSSTNAVTPIKWPKPKWRLWRKKGADTGYKAIHPLTGEEIPAPRQTCPDGVRHYAVMAVPGHDQRDYEFASKYGFTPSPVILAADGSEPDRTGATERRAVYPASSTVWPFEAAFNAIADKPAKKSANVK